MVKEEIGNNLKVCFLVLWTAALADFVVCWYFRDHAWRVHWPHESCSRCHVRVHRQERFVQRLHVEHACWWSRYALRKITIHIFLKMNWYLNAYFTILPLLVIAEPAATPGVNVVTEKGLTFYYSFNPPKSILRAYDCKLHHVCTLVFFFSLFR